MREQLADYCAEVNRVDRTIAGVLDVLVEARPARQDADRLCRRQRPGPAAWQGLALRSGLQRAVHRPLARRGQARRRFARALLSDEDIGPTLLAAAGLSPDEKMTGVSFLPLLKGRIAHAAEVRLRRARPAWQPPVTVNMTNAGYDLSRAVRSDRYKFIYNCTPWIPYAPVDSAGGTAWTQMKAANADGTLSAGLRSAPTSRRPAPSMSCTTSMPIRPS